MVVSALYMIFFFKAVKRMITISIMRHYVARIQRRKRYVKIRWLDRQFPDHEVTEVTIQIVSRRCVFSYNYDNVIFTGISRMICITCPQMNDGVLTSLQLGLIHIPLCLQCHVFILNILNLIATVGKCCIFFLDGLLMIFLHFACKLLPLVADWKTTAHTSLPH